jgi:hypothetical protein
MRSEYENIIKEEEIKIPLAQLFYRIREWDKAWGDYFNHGIKPPTITDFLNKLHEEFEVKKRV